MTPKIEQFLAANRLETPCLVIDLDVVAENYRRLRMAMPAADIYYAVKANPAKPVLEALVGLGSFFDTASAEEIALCFGAGARPEAISYGNTVKKVRDIAWAFEQGIRLFAFDSEEELAKLARHAPGARVYCRIVTSNDGADWPLSRKFGCELDMARDLMLEAAARGLDPYGISFHVGSQQTNPKAWEIAIGRAAMVFSDLRQAGVDVKMLNLGGGYPARYREEVPDLDAYADTIMKAMTRHFGNDIPAMILEPGRSIVAEAGILQAEVVMVARKAYGDEKRWVYLDVGKFGGLAETMDEAIKYPILTSGRGRQGPVVLAGPTCDGVDVMYEKAGYELPLTLHSGDWVRLLSTGAYTTTYASVGFNGFPPLAEHYI